MSLCKSTENCNWFSYAKETAQGGACLLYETCPEIDETTGRYYISGQKECQYDYGEKY